MPFQSLKPKVEEILKHDHLSVDDRLTAVCEILKEGVPYYDWVGFYFRNEDKEELKLDLYVVENRYQNLLLVREDYREYH